jgi:hypothetical protein
VAPVGARRRVGGEAGPPSRARASGALRFFGPGGGAGPGGLKKAAPAPGELLRRARRCPPPAGGRGPAPGPRAGAALSLRVPLARPAGTGRPRRPAVPDLSSLARDMPWTPRHGADTPSPHPKTATAEDTTHLPEVGMPTPPARASRRRRAGDGPQRASHSVTCPCRARAPRRCCRRCCRREGRWHTDSGQGQSPPDRERPGLTGG